MPPCPNYGCVPRSIVRYSTLRARQQCLLRLATKPPTVRNFSSRNVNSDRWQALTWIAQKPHNVTPDDILPAYAHFRTSSEQSEIVPILFASPEFTAWTEPTSPLLAQCITPLFDKLYSGNAPSVVHTVAAVVDGISTPQSQNNGKHTTSSAEGLSLLLANSSSIDASAAPSARVRGSSSEEPSFFLRTRDPNNSTSSQPSHEVGLRLAQTVFRNGRDRTLLGMRWIRDGSSNTYRLDDYQELSTCSVTSLPSETRCSINVPLHPVTQRRRVISSMGNILRQVSKSLTNESDANRGIPASSELEKELPRYVSELGIPHQRVSVWALVEPSETVTSTEDRPQRDFEKLILTGSKIHRVVSGGGGWGKKQGLLSLDPEITFGDQNHAFLSAPLNELFQAQSTSAGQAEMAAFYDILEGKGLEENMASLSQVAAPGDYIQFFVTPASEASTEVDGKPRAATPATLSYSFGVEAPVETEVADSSPSSASSEIVTVIHDHFGAVSESAISYSQEDASESSSRELKCGTKISVPGSRVELSIS